MLTKLLPATTYQAKCSSCGALSTFSVFEASFYDFDTYFGCTTGSYYRLNLELTTEKNGSVTVEEALQPAAEREGGRSNLLHVPEDLPCPACQRACIVKNRQFGAGNFVGCEEQIEAVHLP